MDEPRLAFCQLLFARNGGKFDDEGRPVSSGVRSLCDVAGDCLHCELMQDWLSSLLAQGWRPSWECTDCVKRASKEETIRHRALGGPPQLMLPGFYQSIDKTRGPVSCELCGWDETFLLQLVLRK